MNEFETVNHLMIMNHISYDDLSKRLGQSNSGNLYNSLNKNKNIYVSSLRKILDVLGYEVVIREKGKTDGGYVIDDDTTPSPLRFHDMSLNLDSIFGDSPSLPKKKPGLTVGERNLRSEELKQRIGDLTFSECDKELRKIWGIRDTTSVNQYENEFMKYQNEFAKLYDTTPPVVKSSVVLQKKDKATTKKAKKKVKIPAVYIPQNTEHAHGKVIIQDKDFKVKDMSEKSWQERAKEQKAKQSNLLAELVAGFQMED